MTKRNANSMFVLMSLTIGLVLGTVGTARAQPILERLEQRIRSRVGETPPTAESSQASQAPDGSDVAATEAVPPGTTPVAAGPAQRGYLGLIADDRDEQGRGARVLDVRPEGPAAKAGFEKDDLITTVAGIRVRSLTEMADILELFPPGKQVAFDVVRGQKQRRLSVTLGTRPGDPKASAPIAPPAPAAGTAPGRPPAGEPAAAPSVSGDVPATSDLLRRIEALERRVAELEEALANPKQ